MGEELTSDEVLLIFEKYDLVSNKYKLLRLIREGHLKGRFKTRQEGYRILKEDVHKFLEENSVTYWKEQCVMLQEENRKLEQKLKELAVQSAENAGAVTALNPKREELEGMHRNDLRALCKKLKITGYYKMTKEKMIDLILNKL